MPIKIKTQAGESSPLGISVQEDGINFAIFSQNATRVRLEFFNKPEDKSPSSAIDLDPKFNRTGDVWHVWVKGIKSGQLYGYRVDGPYDLRLGQRFNFKKLL